jgi:hypothetical protein
MFWVDADNSSVALATGLGVRSRSSDAAATVADCELVYPAVVLNVSVADCISSTAFEI